MDVDWFDFELPEELIAQTPLAERSGSRLLALDKLSGQTSHCRFSDLPGFLRAGDTLVLNDTKVIPARLYGVKRGTGAKAEVLLLKDLAGDRWEALVRPAKRLKAGTVIDFGLETHSVEGRGEAVLTAEVESETKMGGRILRMRYNGIFHEILDRLGTMPLPPYIKEQLEDQSRYQTVYACHQGSAAAPTAGLHFTRELLDQIASAGVHIAYVTLHVGLGTFRPVSVAKVEDHPMHSEYYELPQETADLLNRTRSEGGKIVAVGTTSARTLETVAQRGGGPIEPSQGWTDIFIYPGYSFRMTDALLTNFHLPKSSLMMLVSALAGRDNIMAAYRQAIEARYRFFSFGDAMLIH